jgi:Zn-dependent protease with chaperone function
VLLAFARLLPGLARVTVECLRSGVPPGFTGFPWLFAVLCVPPAFVVGWISRLSVLGMSRAREFAADRAAVALTGRPSALASALMKLEHQREWAPRSDLRQVEPYAVLCIVGAWRSRLGRLFSTHPPTTVRVKRLEAIETRLQGTDESGRSRRS